MDRLIKYDFKDDNRKVWLSQEAARVIRANEGNIKRFIDSHIKDFSIILDRHETVEEGEFGGFECRYDGIEFFFFSHKSEIFIIRKIKHEEEDMKERLIMLGQMEMLEDDGYFKTLYDKALKIASEAHEGQTDRGGMPYIEHPKYVAEHVEGRAEKIVALLHDTIEDTHTTIKDISSEFPSIIPWALDVITKLPGENYANYIVRVRNNPIARKVKIEDLKHNMDLSRLAEVSEEDERRAERYSMYLKLLETDYYYEELALGESDPNVRMIDYQIEGYDFHRAMMLIRDADKDRLWKAIEVNDILKDFDAPIYIRIAALMYCCIEMETLSAMGIANNFGEKVWDIYLQMPWNFDIPIEDKTELIEEFISEADYEHKLILLAIAIAELREFENLSYRYGQDGIFKSFAEKLRYEEYFATLLEEFSEYENDEKMRDFYWTHQNLFKDVFVSYHVNKEGSELYQGCDIYCWVWKKDDMEGWVECPVREFPPDEFESMTREEAEALESNWAYEIVRRKKK